MMLEAILAMTVRPPVDCAHGEQRKRKTRSGQVSTTKARELVKAAITESDGITKAQLIDEVSLNMTAATRAVTFFKDQGFIGTEFSGKKGLVIYKWIENNYIIA